MTLEITLDANIFTDSPNDLSAKHPKEHNASSTASARSGLAQVLFRPFNPSICEGLTVGIFERKQDKPAHSEHKKKHRAVNLVKKEGVARSAEQRGPSSALC